MHKDIVSAFARLVGLPLVNPVPVPVADAYIILQLGLAEGVATLTVELVELPVHPEEEEIVTL